MESGALVFRTVIHAKNMFVGVFGLHSFNKKKQAKMSHLVSEYRGHFFVVVDGLKPKST
jgi:hypothetical protein